MTQTQLKTILLTALALGLLSSLGDAQTKHIYYDTVKTVKECVDYAPDTIPVLFKELIIKPDTVIEKWHKGFVIWHTFKKLKDGDFQLPSSSVLWSCGNQPDYYKDYYEPSKSYPGIFLYEDKKTKCKNNILLSFKR